MTKDLAGIRESVKNTRQLVLDEETVGGVAAAFVKQAFALEAPLAIAEGGLLPPAAGDILSFRGKAAALPPWNKPVTLLVSIFEVQVDAGKQRHCALRVDLAGDLPAGTYLAQHGGSPGGQAADKLTAFSLGGLPDALKAEPAALVFTSLDRATLLLAGARGMGQYLSKVLGSAYGDENVVHAVVYPSQDELQYQLRNPLDLSLSLGTFKLATTETGFVRPLRGDPEAASVVSFDGTVGIDDLSCNIGADVDAGNTEMRLYFRDFPTLGQLLKHAGLSVPLPEPLSGTALKELEVGLNLSTGLVDEILFHLTAETLTTDVKAPDGITFQEMDVWGAIVGDSYSLSIDVGFAGEWSFNLGAGEAFVLKPVKVDLGYDHQGGDAPATTYTAAIEGSLGLAGEELSVSASFERADQGEGGQTSWTLTAGLGVDSSIDLSKLLNGLLQGLTLPGDVPNNLELRNVIFYASPTSNEYSIRAQTAHEWKITDGFGLNIDEFHAESTAGKTSGALRVSFDIVETVVRLSAEKSADTWKVEGGAGAGQSIPIGALIKDLAAKFDNKDGATVPEALAGLTFKNLDVTFESPSNNFTFTGEADLPVDGTSIALVIDIALTKNGNTYERTFMGSVTVADYEFELIFDDKNLVPANKPAAPDAATELFIAAYADERKEPQPLRDLIASLSPTIAEPLHTSLQVRLKDALFAYQRKTPAGEGKAPQTNWLFGVDIEGAINLSDLHLPSLPLIGSGSAPADQQALKLLLKVLAAGGAFSQDDTKAISDLLSKGKVGGLSLPDQVTDRLLLGATMQLGPETMQLSPLRLGTFPPAPGNAQEPATQSKGTAAEPDKASAQVQPPAVEPATAPAPAAGPGGQPDPAQWVKIQKAFGPVFFSRVGVAYANSKLTALLDASFSIAGLTISLDGLSMSSPIDSFTPAFDLLGLGIDYRKDPLEIAGAFLGLRENGSVVGFAGMVTVRTEKLALSAIGAYRQMGGEPSLFLYVVADYPLGGPPFFFVTGFAAGFGYNRALQIPGIDDVKSFPLVADVIQEGGPAPLPADQAGQQATLSTKLRDLETKWVQPSIGDIFVAAGVKFTTFKQMESFILLVLKFGQRFEMDLLGMSTLIVPADTGEGVDPVAKAELALKASFVPAEGYLEVRAVLTANSYIISKDAHLTGGFAFYAWFDPSPHAGDFVLTLGGYHPHFEVPDYYPQVPRLALTWQRTPELHIKADAYFALTSAAIMAGGHLEATWTSGDLRAWFKAGADFLIAWKPYHYDIEIYVDIGVSYTFNLFGQHTITAEAGADLHLWGPEFAGTATVHLWIVSFTVNFGDNTTQGMKPLDWKTFEASFLPKEKACSVAVQGGLVRKLEKDAGGSERWIVNPKELVLATSAVIPSNAFSVTGQMASQPADASLNGFGIAPVGVVPKGPKPFTSNHKVTVTKTGATDLASKFSVSPVSKAVPAALWGVPRLTKENLLQPPTPYDDRLVPDALSGFEIRPAPLQDCGNAVELPRESVQYSTDVVENAYRWAEIGYNGDLVGAQAWSTAVTTIDSTTVQREDLLTALGFGKSKPDKPLDK